jgi:hypothetical protein
MRTLFTIVVVLAIGLVAFMPADAQAGPLTYRGGPWDRLIDTGYVFPGLWGNDYYGNGPSISNGVRVNPNGATTTTTVTTPQLQGAPAPQPLGASPPNQAQPQGAPPPNQAPPKGAPPPNQAPAPPQGNVQSSTTTTVTTYPITYTTPILFPRLRR